jgi:hypothetical protein
MNTPTVKDCLTVQPNVRLHDKIYEFADELAAALAIIDGRAHHMEAMVLKHEQQIKDIAAHLLEFKQSITPVAWVGLTDDEIISVAYDDDTSSGSIAFGRAIEAKLREKNGA